MRIMYPYCTIYNAMLNREIMKITLFVSTSEVPAELYACYTHETRWFFTCSPDRTAASAYATAEKPARAHVKTDYLYAARPTRQHTRGKVKRCKT